jgi:xanthine phosphoribosyltransferase
VCEELRNAIRSQGRVEGDLVMVDGFLNHRVDVELMGALGRWFAGELAGHDAVLTSEASGIAPALVTAQALGVPMVFAKKRSAPLDGMLSRLVVSPTKGEPTHLSIAPRTLAGIRNPVVVDDFLSGGHTALALVEMLREAGIKATTAAFAVEKAYAGGRALLEANRIEVVSAATVLGIEDGKPRVA